MKERKEFNILMGERIRVARESAGYTQENLSEMIGVSSQYVSDLERGVVGTSIPTLIKLCDVLSVSSDYLLMRNNHVKTDNIDPMEMMNLMKSLSPEERQMMYQAMSLMMRAFQLNE